MKNSFMENSFTGICAVPRIFRSFLRTVDSHVGILAQGERELDAPLV